MDVVFGLGALGLIALFFIGRGDEPLEQRETLGLVYVVIAVALFLAGCVYIAQRAGVDPFQVAQGVA